MNKIRNILIPMAILSLTLIVGGCTRTGKNPSEITVNSFTASFVESQSTITMSSPVTTQSDPSDIEIPPPPPPPPPIVERVCVSPKNRFIGSAREFTVDEENLLITLDVTYNNYVDLNTLKNCFLDIETPSGEYKLEGVKNEDGSLDLTKEAYLTVTDEEGEKKRFALVVNRTVHDLPIINIRMGNLAPPYTIQRDVYSDMEMYIDCTGAPEFSGTNVISGRIRGRGHSTWKWQKKPYRIKFDEAVSIMGFTENRDWILLANHADKSLIRNIVAYDMGRELGTFVWTAKQYPVDLFINGVYQGVYAIGEQREVAESRIALDKSDDVDRGYLIEVGGADEDMEKNIDYFHTNSGTVKFITFDDPKAEKLSGEQRQFLRDYINAADKAIVNGEDYEEYIDVDSFVDWVIIQELTCNLDSCFRRSCFMTKDKGGKLRMGPIWDFDMAFGNLDMDNPSYDTWFTVGTTDEEAYIGVNWCNYLMEDEEFRARLRERWSEVRDILLERAEKSIAENKAKIYASQAENFELWNTLGYKSGVQSWATANIGTFDGQIEYLRSFIKKRAKWIDENI